jgi:hypothetical protein
VREQHHTLFTHTIECSPNARKGRWVWSRTEHEEVSRWANTKEFMSFINNTTASWSEELVGGSLEDAEFPTGPHPHSVLVVRPVDDATTPPLLEKPSQPVTEGDVVPPFPDPKPIEPEPAPPNPETEPHVQRGAGADRAGDDREEPMPQSAWSDKRERQYEHIKEGLERRGESEDLAEEIAARTINKERARTGEAREAARTSTDDISSGRRGGLRSHRGPGGRTRAQLYEEARRRRIPGRSTMNKAQLEEAVSH